MFGMAIIGFTMAIIKEKIEPTRALFLGLFYLCGPSTLNAMRWPNQSLVSRVSIWALELRFFLLRLVMTDETEETKSVQN